MPVLVYKNGYERQKGKDKDPENIMDRIKESKVILLLVVLFISVLFIAMIRYFLLAIFLAAISSALAMPIFHRFSSWFKGKKKPERRPDLADPDVHGFHPVCTPDWYRYATGSPDKPKRRTLDAAADP